MCTSFDRSIKVELNCVLLHCSNSFYFISISQKKPDKRNTSNPILAKANSVPGCFL